MGDLVPIYSAANAMEAQLLREELDEQGINAWIINEALTGAVGELPPGWSSSPRVVVAADDAQAAREIALVFDRRLVDIRRSGGAPPETVRPVIEQDDWPRCLMCGHRRLASCRFCGTAGTDFPRAYELTGDGQPPLRVVCSMCDEPFVPRFYRQCEHCGYEFDDGLEVDRPAKPIEELPVDLTRVWLVLGGMLLLGVACVGYLWWLLESGLSP